LIIWSGNLPAEIAWYLHRLQTGWRAVGLTLILFHFAAPFVVLLSRQVKRQPQLLVKVAVGILIVRLVDLFWLIAPEFHQTGLSVSWMDVVLPLTLGSIWLACFIWQLRGRAILPLHDPQFDEALGGFCRRGPGRSLGWRKSWKTSIRERWAPRIDMTQTPRMVKQIKGSL
jgi:hypothetical protein